MPAPCADADADNNEAAAALRDAARSERARAAGAAPDHDLPLDDLDDDDEMGDFIEHDGPGGAEAHRARQRALAKSARAQGISMEAAQDIVDVFGQEAEAKQRLELWYYHTAPLEEDEQEPDDVRSVLMIRFLDCTC